MVDQKSIKQTVDRVFTDKELELIQMTANGVKRSEIAEKTKRSIRTIESHLDRLKKEFKCGSVPHLVAFFLRNKLID